MGGGGEATLRKRQATRDVHSVCVSSKVLELLRFEQYAALCAGTVSIGL